MRLASLIRYVASNGQSGTLFRFKTSPTSGELHSESAVINRGGGTNSNFSPFLMFVKATRPLSPTSTFSIPIFWGGRPESDNHFCNPEAFSGESMSQPQGIFWGFPVGFLVVSALVLVVVIEQRIRMFRLKIEWERERGLLWKRA